MSRLTILLCCLWPALVAGADRGGERVIYIQPFRTYTASGYVAADRNIDLLRELKEKLPPLKHAVFEPNPSRFNNLLCRGSYPVYAPNRTPLKVFLESALNMELAESGVLAEDAKRVIRGKLEEFDFSSFGTGKWTIQATFSVEGKSPLAVKHEYEFSLSPGAQRACAAVTGAMLRAVQDFLHAVYSDPRFLELAQ